VEYEFIHSVSTELVFFCLLIEQQVWGILRKYKNLFSLILFSVCSVQWSGIGITPDVDCNDPPLEREVDGELIFFNLHRGSIFKPMSISDG